MYVEKEYFDAKFSRIVDALTSLNKDLKPLTKKNRLGVIEEIFDNQDLCFYLKVSPRALQRYRQHGLLPVRTLLKKNYYFKSDIENLILKLSEMKE